MLLWVALKRSTLLIVLNLVAAITYLVVVWTSGSFAHVQTSVFSSPDSREYRAVGDWILGGPWTHAVAWRPFLFPLLIGLAERIGGIPGVWVLNLLLWFATLNLAALATYRFVKSNWAAAFVFLVLAFNVSLILLSFEGLTELTVVALLAMWAYGLSHLTTRPTPSQLAWALLPVALLVVVKPEFEALLGVVAVVLVIGIFRSHTRRLAAVVFAACLVPIVIQLAVMVHFNGYFGISMIGDRTLRGYYLARLVLAITHTNDLNAARTQTVGLSNVEAARLVIDHLGRAVQVFLSTLKENLLAGSSFLGGLHPRVQSVVTTTQLVFFIVLMVMIPLVAVALWRARDGRLALLCIAALNIFFAGGLTFRQGDRITIVALPIWLIALVLAFREAGGFELPRSVTSRVGSPPTPTSP